MAVGEGVQFVQDGIITFVLDCVGQLDFVQPVPQFLVVLAVLLLQINQLLLQARQVRAGFRAFFRYGYHLLLNWSVESV